jgi:hypothetical protein
MAQVCATSPCTKSQSDGRSFENTVPFGKVKICAFRMIASRTYASLGEWSSPEDVPATVDGGPFPRFSGGIVYRRHGKGRTIQLAEAVNAL